MLLIYSYLTYFYTTFWGPISLTYLPHQTASDIFSQKKLNNCNIHEDSVEPRIRFKENAPDLYRSLLMLEKSINDSGIDRTISNLVKIRASQINGCAWCLDMHTKDALADGESILRISLIAAWWESPQFNEKEKAALEWTEVITLISEKKPDDEVYTRLRVHFGEKEITYLTGAIVAINSWNRLNIAFKTVPGTYVAPERGSK